MTILKHLFVPIALACLPTLALAAPEEIQVYMNEMSAPGAFGLDVHNNFATGSHIVRVTPEFSYGWTPNLELGAYVLSSRDQGQFRIDGEKLRLKFIAPVDGPYFYGANLELGRVNERLDVNPWNGELKGIAGYQGAHWQAALNANLGFKVAGPAPSPATLELAARLAYKLKPDLQIGVEHYNDMGEVRRLGRLGRQARTSYAVLDTTIGAWDLNLGVGRGNGAAVDRWVIKAIVGVPFGK